MSEYRSADDPALGRFLDLLEGDIEGHPEDLVPVTEALVERLRRATEGLEINPYDAIDGSVDI